jgi:hypothetical protein
MRLDLAHGPAHLPQAWKTTLTGSDAVAASAGQPRCVYREDASKWAGARAAARSAPAATGARTRSERHTDRE